MSTSLILPLVLIIAMLFFMSRNQKKQRARQEEMKNNLKSGAHVVTIGGMHAVVESVDTEKQTVDLNAEGVILTFDLTAIRTVKAVETTQAAPAAATDDSTAPKEVSESTTDSQSTATQTESEK
ncbi:preprotein translocase subunit YajC [Convivina intestini]|uniref:Protein translocase subunit yajC n=1 Tax=Convivina intestini TaxID=1505726 RepID=A0A2U1D5X1_9LACO|nr:preprotein translocase subunit YajC [Convivina intestini]PVY83076.1 protein translocase subunit yajC [Convivina intestini]CAH1856553.1 hypothetical protein R077811_01277 [Convivina intestini]SDB98433.1 preprotein translocase subunit YajC [Leuconostocaceae bacterium R-53105]